MADEKRRAEMDQLTALAEEMKTNAEKQLTVESFAIRPSVSWTEKNTKKRIDLKT